MGSPFLRVQGGHLSHEGLVTCLRKKGSSARPSCSGMVSNSFTLKYFYVQAPYLGEPCPEPHPQHSVMLGMVFFFFLIILFYVILRERRSGGGVGRNRQSENLKQTVLRVGSPSGEQGSLHDPESTA